MEAKNKANLAITSIGICVSAGQMWGACHAGWSISLGADAAHELLDCIFNLMFWISVSLEIRSHGDTHGHGHGCPCHGNRDGIWPAIMKMLFGLIAFGTIGVSLSCLFGKRPEIRGGQVALWGFFGSFANLIQIWIFNESCLNEHEGRSMWMKKHLAWDTLQSAAVGFAGIAIWAFGIPYIDDLAGIAIGSAMLREVFKKD